MTAAKRQGGRGSRRRGTPSLPIPALAVSDRTPLAVHVYRCELVEERVLAVPLEQVGNGGEAAAVIAHFLARADRETFVVLLLDRNNGVLGLNVVAMGSLDAVAVSEREVFKPALLRNAERIVLGHNHLHDSPSPSTEDKRLTTALVRAGKALGIPVLDHVIVGRGRFFSFHERGLI